MNMYGRYWGEIEGFLKKKDVEVEETKFTIEKELIKYVK